jgi:hypothetical protein
MGRKTGVRVRMRGGRGRGPRIDHEIHHRQQMLVLPEIFANPALDAIADHRTPGGTDTDGKTESRVVETIQLRADQEQCVGRSKSRAMDGIELRLRE